MPVLYTISSLLQSEPHLYHASNDQAHTSRQDEDSGKGQRTPEDISPGRPLVVQNRTRHRATDQQSQTRRKEGHTDVGAQLRQIGTEEGDCCGKDSLDRAACQANKDRNGDQTRLRFHADPRQHQDTGEQDGWDHDRQVTDLVGDYGRHDATGDRARVHDDQHIERQVPRHAEVDTVLFNVEEWDVETDEDEECSEEPNGEDGVPECLDVDQRA